MHVSLAEQLEVELAKTWRERRDARLANLFASRQEAGQRAEFRLAAWCVAALYILFAVADAVLIPDMAWAALAARVAIGCVYGLAITVQVDRGVPTRVVELQCGLGVVVGFIAWLLIASQSVHEQNVLYYAFYGPVFMMVANLFYNLRTRVALLTSGLITATFFPLIWSAAPGGPDYLVASGLIYVVSFGLTLFINFKLNLERYRVFLNALSAEIQHEEARRRGEELLKLSKTDALTGLANRRATNDLLQDFWSAWTSKKRPFAVLLIDIDFFKLYNDHYGHQRGDKSLVTVARAMEAVVARHGGTVGRFGGEEFIVFLPSSTAGQAWRVADELRRAVQDLRVDHEARPDHLSVVTVSVGAALCRAAAGHAERLVTEADQALYLAKDSGRNCVRLYDGDPAREVRRSSLVEVVQTALRDERVSVAYQPIWNLGTGTLHAAEALMRIDGAAGAPVSPAAFIPVLERSGSIVEFGEWIIRQACRQLASSDTVPLVSVNVSGIQLARPGFASLVRAILTETGVVPGRLALEITEGTQVPGNDTAIRTISELQAVGVRVWLDDFGTGYSGLSSLSTVRFDAVKIDKTFVQGGRTPEGTALLRNTIRLVAETGAELIVEGLETADQVNLVRALGVDLMQGFHLGRPMSPSALEERGARTNNPGDPGMAA